MGKIDDYADSLLAFDTSPIIYFIEENPEFIEILYNLFKLIRDKKRQIIISPITIIEVLIKPMRESNQFLIDEYLRVFMNSDEVKIVPINISIARKTAELRSKYGIRTPDAIQLATALEAGAGNFITNDRRLKKIDEIEVLTLDDLY
jgi:predicted nucleic acid-binding protein